MSDVTFTYAKKESDKLKCIACMDKIKRKLDNLGLQYIMTSDKENILCKVYGDVSFNNGGNETGNSNISGGTTQLPSHIHVCPHSLNQSNCPYTACKYPNMKCYCHNAADLGNNSNNTESDNNSSNTESPAKFTGCLFRIMPTDIYNGIFLHAIKLHGETCDLKMTFNFDDNAATELIEVLKFLIA